MTDLLEVIRAIERRARTVRALRVATLCFSVSIVPALLFFLLERMRIFTAPDGAWLVLAVLPVVVVVASFVIVRSMPVDTPKILLRVDMTLGSEERLSSLYEMHQQGQTGPYREMLESRLRDEKLRWNKALPVGRIALLVPAGLALLAGVLVTSSLFPASRGPALPAVPAVATSTESSSSSLETEGTRGVSAMGSNDPSSTPAASNAQGQHDLQDVLGSLWSTPSASGVISDDGGGLDQLISQQQQAAQRLKELISRIEKRLAEGDGGLTDEERNALSTLAQQIGNESLRQALQGLASEEDPQELQKRLQQTQELAESLQGPSDSSRAQAMRTDPSDSSHQGTSEGLAYSAPMPGGADEKEDHESTGGGTPSAGGMESGTQGERLQGGDEPFGGEGSDDAGSPSGSVSPQFTRREIVADIGSSGDFKDFVTKGVPLERAPEAGSGSPSVSVDYERLRALLSARSLPPGAEEVVRRYFDEITQGGE